MFESFSSSHSRQYSVKEGLIILCGLGWFVAVAHLALLALLALYYLAAWALNAVTVWAVSNAGALSDAAFGAITVLAL